MRILHTADWHIGQTFHEYDRSFEHAQFLNWLVSTIQEKQIDVLLISGDVFDLSNPSAASVKMFYSFLQKAIQANSDLQMIITAGNHDSASRLESPKPLLETSNIHIIGLVDRLENGEIDYEKLIIPIKNKSGNIKAWCMAVPFLRMGDYPSIPDCENPYAEGVAKFYDEVYQVAASKKQEGQVIIGMGHLHTQQAEVTDMDKSERVIMGGVECISTSAFHQDIKYVALGHIHKAQRIGGNTHVQYCGSPLPMSFSELRYKHQIIVFDLTEEGVKNLESIEVPVSVELLRVPSNNSVISEVLYALQQLPAGDAHSNMAPYLEVRVLLDGPEPGLRHKIETALQGKNVRLAKIDVKYPSTEAKKNETAFAADYQLKELKPIEVFSQVYQSKYNAPVPEMIHRLFNQVVEGLSQNRPE